MKLLLENWRRFLSEDSRRVIDLPEDVYISFLSFDGEADFWYASAEDPEGLGANALGRIGIMTHSKNPEEGPCFGAWKVIAVEAVRGWGPLLYDIAMEYATMKGGGLMADREEVTPMARKIWRYYLNNRDDVISHQLDDLENTLTPSEEDNCDQKVSSVSFIAPGSSIESTSLSWQESPLSKRYTKDPTSIQALQQAGKWKRFTP
tara:strand:+ start:1321 stop:1935 length:615 start_codon:yes stop_codon:yes gene_type:complete